MTRKANSRNNNVAYILGGILDIGRSIGSIALVKLLFPALFPIISVNIDILSAIIGLFSPWSIAFARLTKHSVYVALRHFESAVPCISASLALIYVATAFATIAQAEGQPHLKLAEFIGLRAFSVIFILHSNLNYIALVNAGLARVSLIIQMGSLIVSWCSYLVVARLFGSDNLAALALILLLIDALTAFSSRYPVRLGRGPSLRPRLRFYLLKATQRITRPELVTSLSISLSTILFNGVAFSKASESYEQFRLPFAFSGALWFVLYRCTLIILGEKSRISQTSWYSASITSLKSTWFVPILLFAICIALNDAATPNIMIAISFYPVVLLVIAGCATLRNLDLHRDLALINIKMLLLYFSPVAVLMHFECISTQNFVWLIGGSYVARLAFVASSLQQASSGRTRSCTSI